MNKRGGQIAFRAARFWPKSMECLVYYELLLQLYTAIFDLIYNRNFQRPLPSLLLWAPRTEQPRQAQPKYQSR